MFRIINAEIKKTFAKPGIFILTGILIVVLFACAMFYKPAKRDDVILTVESYVDGVSVQDVTITKMYEYFNSLSTTKQNTKYEYDNIISNAEDYINFYYVVYYPTSSYVGNNHITASGDYVLKSTIDAQVEVVKQKWALFIENLTNNPGLNTDVLRQEVKTSLNQITSYLVSIGKSETKTVLVKTQDYEDFAKYLKQADAILDTEVDNSASWDTVRTNLGDTKFPNTLKAYADKIHEFKPTEKVLEKAITYIAEAKEYLGNYPTLEVEGKGLLNEIYEFYKTNGSKTESVYKTNFNKLLTKYKLMSQEIKTICNSSVNVNVLQKFSPNDITKYRSFEKENFYSLKEDLTRNEYYLNTKTFEFEYATPLNITQASNTKTNAYDFAYFALKLCAFIIIIYCVVLAAGSIAGEQQAGTLKLLAIRPYSRTKLFLGKMMATISVGVILLLLSSIATLIAGVITYSASSLPVLVIFNASQAIKMNVFLEFFVMLFTMFFELVFFVIMAYGISTIFKSNVGAVAISIMIYFVSLILNTMASSISALRFLPFTNMNLFKYFGSSFLSNSTGFLFSVLTPSVVVGADFVFSVLISGIFALVVLIATIFVFNKRDLR